MPSWPSLHLDGARDRPRLRLRARKWVLLLLLHEEGRKEGVWREKDSLAAATACRRSPFERRERERERAPEERSDLRIAPGRARPRARSRGGKPKRARGVREVEGGKMSSRVPSLMNDDGGAQSAHARRWWCGGDAMQPESPDRLANGRHQNESNVMQ